MFEFSTVGGVTIAVGLLLVLGGANRTTPLDGLCLRCDERGKMPITRPGSNALEVLLWVAGLVPGIVYNLWRNSGRSAQCGSCGSRDCIPVTTNRAKAQAK